MNAAEAYARVLEAQRAFADGDGDEDDIDRAQADLADAERADR